ncbi:hypothetical protein I6J18_16030 [Peribacillus psychrosaccharolyticus]|uniref:Uncharacterized protein n=1 Tax=Peribacillus psychrosaccharolyticus TaxID=1407 RepID=A0A974RZ41_PERPY|nr:hypothetical protein [Peribacillus psychrosaccharolyticus]MEC2055463.1 hypothetical protein [Peribacillus psychrosaccharolyticus]MED3743508.1 hypothetical protein [Peribacillus psychrosaccharolyticus]QQS99141.1 hypothetical protein I6J18_16030 [Peribacillus psychrosaccharolyticus]
MSHQKKKSSKPNEKEKDTLFLKAKPEKFNEPNRQNGSSGPVIAKLKHVRERYTKKAAHILRAAVIC